VGLWSFPVGAVDVYGGQFGPDLFVVAGPHSSERGLHLYRREGTSDDGSPVFGDRRFVEQPFGESGPNAVAQSPDGTIYAFGFAVGALDTARYDPVRCAFEMVTEHAIPIPALPELPGGHSAASLLGVSFNANASLDVWLGVSDGKSHRPSGPDGRDPDYVPYDGRGIWRGGIASSQLWHAHVHDPITGPADPARQLSDGVRDTVGGFGAAVRVDLGGMSALISGTQLGNLLCHTLDNDAPVPRRHVVDTDEIAMRHPTVGAWPCAYPNADAVWSDIIVGGEGALQYYRYSGVITERGNAVYSAPTPVLERDAALFTGSLPVLSAVDWDGDGVRDIVAGNSEGRIVFCRNVGSDAEPRFAPGVPISADGHEIHVQAGYRGSIQGPMEARWGYVCPTVVDWDGDSLLDIVMSDITGTHTVFLNRGTPTEPRLERGRTLYCDSLPIHGSWRVQPAVARYQDEESGETRVSYIALDDDDQFHHYRQIDIENVEDIGKLRIEDGTHIGANFLGAGGTGRLKLVLHDWDGDGLLDLIVGTPRHGSVPDAEAGLPQSLGKKGAAVLFMKNTGSNDQPVFRSPVMMKFRGEPIYVGQHACGPAVFGSGPEADLIVGDQEGRIIYYDRKDLSV
jgi:hypothetical protein